MTQKLHYQVFIYKEYKNTGAPGWLSWLNIHLLISAQLMISHFSHIPSTESAWDSLSPSLSVPTPLCLSLSLKINFKKKNTKILIQKDTCTSMFTAALSTIAKLWKQPNCPLVNEWIKEMWCVCMCINTMNITQPSKGMKSCHLQ